MEIDAGDAIEIDLSVKAPRSSGLKVEEIDREDVGPGRDESAPSECERIGSVPGLLPSPACAEEDDDEVRMGGPRESTGSIPPPAGKNGPMDSPKIKRVSRYEGG